MGHGISPGMVEATALAESRGMEPGRKGNGIMIQLDVTLIDGSHHRLWFETVDELMRFTDCINRLRKERAS